MNEAVITKTLRIYWWRFSNEKKLDTQIRANKRFRDERKQGEQCWRRRSTLTIFRTPSRILNISLLKALTKKSKQTRLFRLSSKPNSCLNTLSRHKNNFNALISDPQRLVHRTKLIFRTKSPESIKRIMNTNTSASQKIQSGHDLTKKHDG